MITGEFQAMTWLQSGYECSFPNDRLWNHLWYNVIFTTGMLWHNGTVKDTLPNEIPANTLAPSSPAHSDDLSCLKLQIKLFTTSKFSVYEPVRYTKYHSRSQTQTRSYAHLSSDVLKDLANIISTPLNTMINQCLCSGMFLALLKLLKRYPF